MLGIIFLVLIAIPLVSFGVSANNLVFMRKTLPFINGTSSGKAFFYHHLHNLQLNILRSTEF